jgi:signal transduction histidine kinase
MKHIICIENVPDAQNRGSGYSASTIAAAIANAAPAFTSESVASVADALPLLRRKQQGLVVVDCRAVEAAEFERLHRALQPYPRIVLIAVIPEATYAAIRQALSLGAHDVITAPLQPEEIKAVIWRQYEHVLAIHQEIQHIIHDVALKISFALPHEFRTPLNSLIGFIGLLRHQALPQEELTTAYSYLESSVNRLRQTAEKFLLYAELEKIAMNTELKETFLSHCFATYGVQSLTVELAHETLEALDRLDDLTLHTAPDDCAVQMRAQHIRFIISEVLTNACKFSEPHTPITITTEINNKAFCLCIQDNGRGFQSTELSQIHAFNQFGRERYEQQGIGFGLPIVRKIIALYGGTLEIASKENEGTTVTVMIPLAPTTHYEEGYNDVQYITMHSIYQ